MSILEKLGLKKKEKLWAIGDHRVKSYTVKIPGTEVHGMPDSGRNGTRYRCVDCEQDAPTREEFKEMRCYEVIQNG